MSQRTEILEEAPAGPSSRAIDLKVQYDPLLLEEGGEVQDSLPPYNRE